MSTLASRPFWSLHTHSKFSFKDALPSVEQIVARAAELEYPALGLTDHGSVSGAVQLYRGCMKVGIEPLPGIELYVVPDSETAGRKDSLHLTVNAYTEAGYRNLVRMATLTTRRYWYKPQIDMADFAQMAADGHTEGLAVSTGCFFGLIPQTLIRQGEGAAIQVAQALAGWFPRVYVELQNHGIGVHNTGVDITDDEVIAGVWEVAQRAGLPCVITRDSHFIHEHQKPLHDGLKRLIGFSDDPNDAVFPGGGYHMTDLAGLREFFEPKYLAAGMEGLSDLADAACLRLPELEEFHLKIPDVSLGGDPHAELAEMVMVKLSGPEKADPAVMAQITAELDTLAKTGYASYFLLVNRIAAFMDGAGIRYTTRGSGAASKIAQVLGWNHIDPVRYELRFDRFLSTSRIKAPDFDLDIDHTRRDEVAAFVEAHWAVRLIGSHRHYTLEGDDNDDEESKGSLRQAYFSSLSDQGATKPHWSAVPRADKSLLHQLADQNLISSYGRHATGYIVAPDEASVAELPLAYIASSKTVITAYSKKDVEILGFLKVDLIGSRTMTAVRIMEELSGIRFEDIPEDDRPTFAAIGAGRNDGVFQLKGWAMNTGCRRLRPKSVEDIIAACALFRPAAMKSGATEEYLDRKKKLEEIPTRHPDIMAATAKTYGVLLYQEEVMDCFTALGMSTAQLEVMLDAVKASNDASVGAAKAIRDNMDLIESLATARGWSHQDIAWLTTALASYADYSFNRAHAARYGLLSYHLAWFKLHHPTWFWTGILVANADLASKTVGGYVTSARKDGVRVMPAHVNHSKVSYSYDAKYKAIRKGLASVKGVGPIAAADLVANAPFASLVDLGQRSNNTAVSGSIALACKKPLAQAIGKIAALHEADALSGLEME